MVHLIGIAGGSGAGKSTLAYGLQDAYPDYIEVVHFDDYHKKKDKVPIFRGMTNWDSPEAIDFDKLFFDLKILISGNPVEIMTKSERHNPNYKTNGRIPHILNPKEIILVEGYLALRDQRIRELYSYSVFLALDFEERTSRRTKFIDEMYKEKILIPMHQKYVEPTKYYAKMIIDVGKNTPEIIQKLVLNELRLKGLLLH